MCSQDNTGYSVVLFSLHFPIFYLSAVLEFIYTELLFLEKHFFSYYLWEEVRLLGMEYVLLPFLFLFSIEDTRFSAQIARLALQNEPVAHR